MSLFKYRPLALGVFALCVGIILSYFLGNIFSICLIALGIIGLIFLAIWHIKKNNRASVKLLIYLLPLCLLIVVCGIVPLCTFSKDTRLADEYAGKTLDTQMLVNRVVSERESGSTVIAENDELKIALYLPTYYGEDGEQMSVRAGDTIKAKITFRRLRSSSVGYSEREYYLDKGIFLFGDCEGFEIISRGEFVFEQELRKINSYFDSLLEKRLNSDTASLTSAMLLGNKDRLDNEIERDFSRLGISHILALSGLHISLIIALFDALLSTLKLRNQLKCLILIALIVGFVAITGFSESAMRAGLMLAIMYTLSLIGNEGDGVSSLFCAVGIIAIFDPYALFSTSLQLSFFAMLGCMCSGHFTKRVKPLYRIRPKFIRGMVYSLITSVVVVLFTLPIMALKFDYTSLLAPIFNIIFVPILTLLLYFAPFVLLIGGVPILSYIVIFPAECVAKLTLFLIKWISKADFLTMSLVGIGEKIGAILLVLAMVLVIVLSRERIKYAIITLCLGVCVLGGASLFTTIHHYNSVSVSSLNGFSSDVVAIESENEVMIIEMSKPRTLTTSTSASYASSLGYADIDTYVITDYSRGLVDALDKATDYTLVRKILLPIPKTNEERELFESAKAFGAEKQIIIENIPEKYDFGEVCVEFEELYMLSHFLKRSIVFSASARGKSVTYLGSSANEVASDEPYNHARNAQVVIFGSYGAKYCCEFSYNLANASDIVFYGNSYEFIRKPINANVIIDRIARFTFK